MTNACMNWCHQVWHLSCKKFGMNACVQMVATQPSNFFTQLESLLSDSVTHEDKHNLSDMM